MDGTVHGSVPVAAASERVIGFTAFVVVRLIRHLTAAIVTVHKTGQQAFLLVRSFLYAACSVFQSSVRLLPKLAVNDRLVSVLKHKAFLIGGKPSAASSKMCFTT